MSQRNSQYIYQRMTAGAFSTESAQIEVNGRDLRTKFGSAFLSLVGFIIGIRLDPTYTNAPNVAQHNRLLRSVTFNDGHMNLVVSDGNALRLSEQVELAARPQEEVLTNGGSTNPRFWTRALWLGPAGFRDAPNGYGVPCAALKQAKLQIDLNTFANVGADTTAWTGNIYVIAVLEARKDLVLGPTFVRKTTQGSNDFKIFGRARYSSVLLCDAATYVPLTTADVGDLVVEVDSNDSIYSPSIPSPELTRVFNHIAGKGQFNGVPVGERVDATYDIGQLTLNPGTPTALVAAILDAQVAVFSPPGMRMSKLTVCPKDHLRIATTGTATALHCVYNRFEPRTPEHLAFYLEQISTELKRPVVPESLKVAKLEKGGKVSELEKEWYPLKLKVA